MPSRVIREGLLDSPRYWAAGTQAQNFFVRLLLVADDFGCFNAARLVIGRRCFQQPPSQSKLDGLYKQLADVDLVRFYYAGPENSPSIFGFIPKFRQTMRQMRAKHPRPPDSLIEDDSDAEKKFLQHKSLFVDMPSTRTTPDRQMQRTRSPDLDLDFDLESISRRNDPEVPLPSVAGTALPSVADLDPILNNGLRVKGDGQVNSKGIPKGPMAKALELRMAINDGEGVSDYRRRVERAWDEKHGRQQAIGGNHDVH